MVQYRKKRPEEEEIFPRMPKRRPRVERDDREPVPYTVCRPSFGAGNGQPLGYATLSHSSLKSWAKVAKAQSHNRREIYTPNAREDGPEPIELLEEQSGPYIDRVKQVLTEHGVSHDVRANVGAIATEDVYGASPEYWNRDGDWRLKGPDIVNDPAVQAAVRLARRKHGKLLISCALHLDEDSPHVHVVAVPLVYREHAPRGPKPKDCPLDAQGKPIDYRPKVGKWSLDVSSLRGQSSKLELAHDEWAAECESLGLIRGARGSEMTEEDRRARRASQTGRASKAGKAIRLEGERLLAEARGEAECLRADLMKGAEEANLAAKAAREKAEADEKEAAEAKAAAEQMRAQAAAQLRQNQEREAALAEAHRKAEERAAAAKKQADENKARAQALALREKQLGVLAKGLDDANGMNLSADELGRLQGRTAHLPEEERQAFKSPWTKTMLSLGLNIAAGLERLRRDAAVTAEKVRTLEAREQELSAREDEVVRIKAALGRTRELSVNFLAAWKAVPDDQRTPVVQSAFDAAAELGRNEDPPGWTGPRGGGMGL